MITLKQGIKLSAIADKLNLKIDNPGADAEKVGADMMMKILTKAHLAEQEIYAFVADVKRISVEEAQDVDLMQFIKEIASDAGVINFFRSAGVQKGQE